MCLDAHDAVQSAFVRCLQEPLQDVGCSPHSFYEECAAFVATVLQHLGHQQARLFSFVR